MPYSIEQRDTQLKGSKAPIRYHLYFDLAAQHLARVEMEVDAVLANEGTVTLVMPTWLPGSYKIRDFSSNVGSFAAHDRNGKPLKHEWIDKNHVRISGVNRSLKASYTYYGFERTVQHTHITRWHAFINPGNCCFYVEGRTDEIHHMIFHFADSTDWKSVSTALSPVRADNATFGALNYDILVDSPVEIGNHFTASFTLHGAKHDVAVAGVGDYDAPWIVEQIKPIVEHGKKLFRSLPYDRYVFIIQLYPKVYGGLEHARSHVSLFDSEAFVDKKNVARFLSLITHEYFHTWNVKRIRPAELGPFDYTKERYTSMLYLAEGATSYYDDLSTYRCGFFTEKEYLDALGEQHLQALADVPGRLATSIKESSFLTWVKLYLPSADTNNRYVSYYLKGGILWWLLDLHIIAATNGRKRLDDGMRALMRRYNNKPGVGISEGEMIAILSLACDTDLRAVLRRWLDTPAELPTESLLAKFGMALVKQKPNDENTFGEKRAFHAKPVDWFMGMMVKESPAGLQVARVLTGSPAEAASIGADDELIAINGVRVTTQKQWDTIARSSRLDREITIVGASEGKLYLTTLIATPPKKKYLVKLERPTAAQKKLFAVWAKR